MVVPCHEAARDLDRCLGALRAHNGPGLEIVVVDDASTRDDPAEVAARHGARCLRLERNAGPAVARNAGVEATDGSVVVFIDADVVVHEDTIALAVDTLDGDATLGACFGSYDAHPAAPGFWSQFRNLYHRWVHQRGDAEASTFWTGCGAVRRVAFEAAGGFSAALSRMGMEDIDLGYRLRDTGWRIRLVREMKCIHLKHWRFASMVRTDIFGRGVPWMLLLLARGGAEADLNIDPRARLATLLGGALPLLALAGLAWPPAFAIALGAGGLIALLQWGFLREARRLRGTAFALACVPALWVFFACCAVSIPIALLRHVTGRGLAGRLATPPASGTSASGGG